MAFFLNKSTLASHFRSQSQVDPSSLSSRRGFHVEPGTREKALLAEDPCLRRFRSHKKAVSRLKTFGDVLTIVVIAATLMWMVCVWMKCLDGVRSYCVTRMSSLYSFLRGEN
ncbi:succinate dehydrogenase subunit 7B [Cucumis melo var. makuwa]|uniref:Succinate dehydrogenase subunit 7B n=1 Tax=Cucumis melo var. makuwa TaxID=1194695 RepID=A0A5A7UWD7_CUCMM|nr:succinate dehydrogenase subunit 7B [Cucumis melo var. makuwa]